MRESGVVRWGLLGGLTAVFVAAIGMVESFQARLVVDQDDRRAGPRGL